MGPLYSRASLWVSMVWACVFPIMCIPGLPGLIWGCLDKSHDHWTPWSSLPYLSCTCMLSCFQSCPTLCDPMDCRPPDSSVHGISQARILEWVAIAYFGIFVTQGLNLHLLCLLHWQAGSLPLAPPEKPQELSSFEPWEELGMCMPSRFSHARPLSESVDEASMVLPNDLELTPK